MKVDHNEFGLVSRLCNIVLDQKFKFDNISGEFVGNTSSGYVFKCHDISSIKRFIVPYISNNAKILLKDYGDTRIINIKISAIKWLDNNGTIIKQENRTSIIDYAEDLDSKDLTLNFDIEEDLKDNMKEDYISYEDAEDKITYEEKDINNTEIY